VQDVHLDCSYSATDISAFEPSTEDQVRAKHEKFTLLPKEKVMIRLKVSVVKPGMLKINGVRWLLCGIAYGAQDFDVRGPKRKKVGPNQPDRDHPPHRRLLFQVLPKIPRVEATFENFPENMFAGEVCKCSLTLHNVGAAPLHMLRIASTNNSLIFDKFAVVQQEEQSLIDFGGAQSVDPVYKKGLYELPEDFTLNPGMKIKCTVWIYTTQVGHVGMHCAFYFQPTQSHPKMRFRVLHCTQHVQVFSSIQLSGEMLLSEVSTRQILLHTKIRNCNTHDTFFIQKLLESNGTHDLNTVGARALNTNGTHRVNPNEQTAIFIEADEKPPAIEALTKSLGDVSLGGGPQEPVPGGLEQCVYESLKESLVLSKLEAQGSKKGMHFPLLVFWHTNSRVTSRAHSGVVGMNFFMKADKPIHMAVASPQQIVHNFQQESICIIPCKISIFNASQESVSGTLVLDSAVKEIKASWRRTPLASSSAPAGANASAAGRVPGPPGAATQQHALEENELSGCLPYSWCGKLAHKFKDLSPYETKEVEATVCVFAAGCYEIDAFRLQWSFSNTNFSQYELPGSRFCLNVSG